MRLAGLANSSDPAAQLDGLNYPSFFGKIAGALGSAISSAQTNVTVERDLGIQARDLRQQSSGVSLDEQAVKVMEFQRAYQAASKMVTVLDGLLETLMQMAPR
jgi:flagellar hook-associated protein 1 FlgK